MNPKEMNQISQADVLQQCPECRRFIRFGSVVALSFGAGMAAAREGRLARAECGQDDCAAVAQANADRDAASRRRELESWQASRRKSKDLRQRDVSRPVDFRSRVSAADARNPLPPERDFDEPRTVNNFGQREFEASGAGDSSTALLVAWFRQPENFGKWFTKKFLESVVMQGKSGCCNNRAKAARERHDWGDNYVDNKMIEVEGCLQSHYALVPIAAAVRLSQEQKRKLQPNDEASGLKPRGFNP
jgi:hypothetical protein